MSSPFVYIYAVGSGEGESKKEEEDLSAPLSTHTHAFVYTHRCSSITGFRPKIFLFVNFLLGFSIKGSQLTDSKRIKNLFIDFLGRLIGPRKSN